MLSGSYHFIVVVVVVDVVFSDHNPIVIILTSYARTHARARTAPTLSSTHVS